MQTNSYQGIVITDGTDSFAVFTYQCGAMTWSGNATIGYNAGGSQFENHPLSGSSNTESIGCMNYNNTVWTNIVFKLTPNSKTTYQLIVYIIIYQLIFSLQCLHFYSIHISIITSKD